MSVSEHTNILQSTEFNFDQARVYTEDAAPEGVVYNTAVEPMSENVAIGRFTGVYKDGEGLISQIDVTAGANTSGVTKKPTAALIENTRNISVPCLDNKIDVALATVKFCQVVSVYIYGGTNRLSIPYLENVTAGEFVEGVFTSKIIFDGKPYLYENPIVSVRMYKQSDDTEYYADTDYTVSLSLDKEDGKDVLTAEITVIPETDLATYLATDSAAVKILIAPVQEEALLTEGVDYKLYYEQSASGKITTYIHPIAPAGYDGMSAALRINYRMDTYGGLLYGITIADTGAHDPHDVAVWTSGCFKKSAIRNYSSLFEATDGFSFV